MLSKSELVYADLRKRILHGEFSPGYRLVLARIAEEHEVSPVPVREALRRLEAEGLVRYTLNVGAEVVGVNPTDYADTMQILAFLEGAATMLAAPHLTAAQVAEARAVNDQMRQVRTGEHPMEFTRLNHRFHRILCEPCGNAHLFEVLEREWERMDQIRRSSFSFVPERSLDSVVEHEQILALIEQGAPAHEVEQLTRDHILRTMERFLGANRSARPHADAH